MLVPKINIDANLPSGAVTVNASEKAIDLGLVGKVATIVNLFQSKFADAMPDLTPWLNDPATRATIDPHSIDFGFHFPRRAQVHSDYTILLQIRLRPGQSQVARIEVSSHSFYGCLWEFSTTANWRFWGGTGMNPQYQLKIESCCRDIIRIFSGAEYSTQNRDF
jgi:hypothetical protein